MDIQDEQKLAKAGDLREAENYGESSKEYTESLISLIDKQDYQALIHSLGGQSLIYKILARKTNDQIYKNLALAFAKEAVNILEQRQEQVDPHAQSIALSSYADALLMDNKPAEALPYFEKALSVSPAEDSEKGRLKSHVGDVKYRLGDKQTGLDMLNESLSMIRAGDMNAYHIRVWETGAMNALAKIYAAEKESEKAKSLAHESLNIATEHNLSIRKREAEEILQKLSENRTDFSI